MIPLAVAAETPALNSRAVQLSNALKLPFSPIDSQKYPYLLVVRADRLVLHETQNKRIKPIYVDFLSPQLTYRRKSQQREFLKQAMGSLKPKTSLIVDATAGFGEDAFMLASKGYQVIMLERSEILAALLQDGLAKIHATPEQFIGISLEFKHTDARIYLPELAKTTNIDVVYLDPMFPERKKSALSGKKMEILRVLIGENHDAGELLDIARNTAKNRVIVKRPRYAAPLANKQPTFSIQGNAARFDVYSLTNGLYF
jgi:16S rRNA (guanine1516-N2)-methyltransferase